MAAAAAAAGLTALWCVVVPDKAETTQGLQSFLIRWGHPASWACLTALALLVVADAPPRPRTVAGTAALATYVAFLAALLL